MSKEEKVRLGDSGYRPGGGCGRRLGQFGGGFMSAPSGSFLFDPHSAHLAIAWHNLSCRPRRDTIRYSQLSTRMQHLKILPSS